MQWDGRTESDGHADLVDDPVVLTRELVRIDSVNPALVPGGAGEGAIAAVCAGWLRARGFDVDVVGDATRPTVLARAAGTGGGAAVVLNGHLDTVGVTSYVGDPFAADLDGDRLVGRGTYDMKSGVAALLVAAATAAREPRRGDVLVALVADEEHGSLGTEASLARQRPDAAIVVEPTGLDAVLAHRGFAWVEVTLTGRASHGSQPELGVDALEGARRVMDAVAALADELAVAPAHPLTGRGSARVATVAGGSDAATVADRAVLVLERRSVPGETVDGVLGDLERRVRAAAQSVPGLACDVRRIAARGPLETPADVAVATALLAAAEAELGRPAVVRGEPWWTDAGLYAGAGIPAVVFGVAGGGAHADAEWVEVPSIGMLARVLVRTVLDLTR